MRAIKPNKEFYIYNRFDFLYFRDYVYEKSISIPVLKEEKYVHISISKPGLKEEKYVQNTYKYNCTLFKEQKVCLNISIPDLKEGKYV